LFVTTDLDTLLIALYVLIDDHVISPTRQHRRVCLAERGIGPAFQMFGSVVVWRCHGPAPCQVAPFTPATRA